MLWLFPPENWTVAGLRIWLVLTARGGLALPSKWTQHESQCTRDTQSLSRLATLFFWVGSKRLKKIPTGALTRRRLGLCLQGRPPFQSSLFGGDSWD